MGRMLKKLPPGSFLLIKERDKMKEEETIISKLVVKEQSEFEEWILKNTALGYSALRGWRDEFGIVDYEDIDIRNKWSGWLAAKTGFKSWERNI